MYCNAWQRSNERSRTLADLEGWAHWIYIGTPHELCYMSPSIEMGIAIAKNLKTNK